MANVWLRLSAETSNDPKLIGIAAAAKVQFVVVLGLWTHLLCRARKNETPGTFTETPSELACVMGMDESTVIEIMAHFEFHKRNLIEGNRIAKWDKYQKASDSSSERVARWRASKKPAEKKEQPKENQKVSDIVTLHPKPERKVHPNVTVAMELGTKIMDEMGVLYNTRLFNQMTTPLTPLFDHGIPVEFIEDTIRKAWKAKENQGDLPNTFNYYVPVVKKAWDRANQKLEGTMGNVKQPYATGTSRNTGEDIDSRRKAILAGLGFAPEMDARRTSSG